MSTEHHLDDATLVAVLDGEPAVPARAHLASCPTCEARLTWLRRRSEQVGGLLAEAAPRAAPAWDATFLAQLETAEGSGPPTWWRSPALRWAAVLVLLAGALAAPPVRAFLAGAASAVWTAVTGAPSEVPTVTDEAETTEVSAPISGSRLHLRIDADHPGEVRLIPTGGTDATAALTGGAELEILVESDGFRITGTVAMRVDLEVGVPAGVEEIVLEVEGVERIRRAAPTDGPIVLSLGGG